MEFLDAIDVVKEAEQRIGSLLAKEPPMKVVDLIEAVLRMSDPRASQEQVPEDAVPLAISFMEQRGELKIEENLVRPSQAPPRITEPEVQPGFERIGRETSRVSARTPGQVDRDRVLYSSAFQRLAGVTQVIPAESGLRIQNRLTHSLRVALVARELTEILQAIHGDHEFLQAVDRNIVEAACLAHDIGHPPFGHATERAIQVFAASRDISFEGNAQSFRIVTRLSGGPLEVQLRGLNLTKSTLNGMLKYPYGKSKKDDAHEKFGYYTDDTTQFNFARGGWPKDVDGDRREARAQRSIEAEIMDWSDDIAYSVHDLEDFYRARVIPFSMLAESSGEQERFARHFRNRKRVPDDRSADRALEELFHVIAAKLRQPFDGTRLARANLREIAVDLTSRMMSAMRPATPSASNGWSLLQVAPQERALAEVLKHLMWHYLIERPTLATMQAGHCKAVSTLLEYYAEAINPGRCDERLPLAHRLELQKADDNRVQRARVIVDFVSGMTEHQVIALHRRIAGVHESSLLTPVAEL